VILIGINLLPEREIIKRGEWRTLRGWLGALGEERLSKRPRLCLAQAWSLLYTGAQTKTDRWLKIAEGHLSAYRSCDIIPDNGGTDPVSENGSDLENKIEARMLTGEILALRATLASMLGDTSKTIELGDRSLQYLPDNDEFLRSVIILSIGVASGKLRNLTRLTQTPPFSFWLSLFRFQPAAFSRPFFQFAFAKQYNCWRILGQCRISGN